MSNAENLKVATPAQPKPVKKPPAKPAQPAAKPAQAMPQPVTPRPSHKLRHILIGLSFLLLVLLPTVGGAFYLYTQAADQYHSTAAFSVRSEEVSNPLDALSAFTQTGASSAPDSEILYDFIRSQPLVEQIDAEIDLRSRYNLPQDDPVFTLGEDGSIETLVDYWDRMVSVAIDSNTGVLKLETRGFTPDDAKLINEKIIEKSSLLVEDLSRIAREDAMKFTRQDVAAAEERLRNQRRLIREFRSQYQIIDPEADVQSQIGVVSALQAQLAEALVEFETIRSYSERNDPRLENLQRRVDAIRNQIASERNIVSNAYGGNKPLSEIIGEFEELLVDLEFSQNAYTAALASEEQARVEARRTSRYLAVHIPPTLAQESLYPDRPLLIVILFACAFAAWGVLVMIYYNVRDRR